MNLNALRYFYESAQYDTLTEASYNLHISQPALTKHIKNLENEYNIKLIKKVGRNISLTSLGKQLVKEAAPLFEQEKRIESFLEGQKKNEIITIGTTQLNSEKLLQQITKINHHHFKLVTENTEEIFRLLQAEKIDFAILPENSKFVHFEKEKLTSDELIFVAHPDYCPDCLKEEDLENFQFIKREDGSFLQSILNQHPIIQQLFSIEVSSHRDALLAARYKQGIYICSKESAADFIILNQLQAVTIENFPNIQRDFYLYYHRKQQTTFSNTIKKEIRKNF